MTEKSNRIAALENGIREIADDCRDVAPAIEKRLLSLLDQDARHRMSEAERLAIFDAMEVELVESRALHEATKETVRLSVARIAELEAQLIRLLKNEIAQLNKPD